MKVTLNLTALLDEGKITKEEATRLTILASRDTASVGFNVLIGFGVLAICGGAVALVPSATTAIVVGVLVALVGLGLLHSARESWGLLGNISLLTGALMASAGAVIAQSGSRASFLEVTALLAGASVASGSGLLIALAVLCLSSALGTKTAYGHGMYVLMVSAPGTTVLVFSLLGVAAFMISKHLSSSYSRLAIIGSRTCAVLVNLGFWVGSLWGSGKYEPDLFAVPSITYSFGWAIALIAGGVWAVTNNRPWLLNLVACFAAVHFYTQWFESLGASPTSILIAGLIAVGIAMSLRAYNTARREQN